MKKKGDLLGKDHLHDTVEEMIQIWDLTDLKPKLGWFTCSNHRVGAASISARLDWFLVHSTLMDDKKIIASKILPKLLSDHHPISVLFEKEEELSPIPFRFIPCWIEREGFMDTVSQAWSHYVIGSPSFVWEQKLKQTKLALKKWVKTPFSSPMINKKERVGELSAFQFGMENSEIINSN